MFWIPRTLMVLAICSVFMAFIGVAQNADPTDDTGRVLQCAEPSVENGFVQGEEDGTKRTYNYLDQIKIICEDSFNLLGDRRIKCNEDGHWSSNPPFCEEITCSRLPQPFNGTITPTPLTSKIGTLINVTCDHGFLLMGPPQLNCSINGTWSPERMPYCREMKCPNIPMIQNGIMSPGFLDGPGSVNFTCDKTFELIGDSSLTCTEDGDWIPNVMPFCYKFGEIIRMSGQPTDQPKKPDKECNCSDKPNEESKWQCGRWSLFNILSVSIGIVGTSVCFCKDKICRRIYVCIGQGAESNTNPEELTSNTNPEEQPSNTNHESHPLNPSP